VICGIQADRFVYTEFAGSTAGAGFVYAEKFVQPADNMKEIGLGDYNRVVNY